MCVNFTFSSLLSQRESLGSFSGLTPPPSPASHPGICRPWRGGIFADCRCGVLALRLKLQESQLTWAVMLTKDTHNTHPMSILPHAQGCCPDLSSMKHMVTCWCQATAFILSGLVMTLASSVAVFIRAKRKLTGCMHTEWINLMS